jgi:hypothetical protein
MGDKLVEPEDVRRKGKGIVQVPIKPVKQFTSWSFSRWKDWMECPLKARYKYLDKVPEGVKGPALLRGEDIHKDAQQFTQGTVRKLPPSLKLFKKEFTELKKVKAIAEGKWAMKVDWSPVDFFDWEKAWCRVVLDAHFYIPRRRHAVVIDHKTGKIYPDNRAQVELYVIAGFAHYEMAETIEARLWYLDQGEILPKGDEGMFTRKKDLPKLQKKWKQNVIPMLTDKRFLPRPGDYCARCPFSRRRNGPCKY